MYLDSTTRLDSFPLKCPQPLVKLAAKCYARHSCGFPMLKVRFYSLQRSFKLFINTERSSHCPGLSMNRYNR